MNKIALLLLNLLVLISLVSYYSVNTLSTARVQMLSNPGRLLVAAVLPTPVQPGETLPHEWFRQRWREPTVSPVIVPPIVLEISSDLLLFVCI